MLDSLLIGLLFVGLLVLSFAAETALLAWFFWALAETGFIDHGFQSIGAACTVAAPLWVATALGAWGSRD